MRFTRLKKIRVGGNFSREKFPISNFSKTEIHEQLSTYQASFNFSLDIDRVYP
jgi:hypothetical protein